MGRTCEQWIEAYGSIGGDFHDDADVINSIEALLLIAATQANALSPNTCDYSAAHIEECVALMQLAIKETFYE